MTISMESLAMEARKLGVDCLYSEKQHFISASLWNRLSFWTGLFAASLGGVAGLSGLSAIEGGGKLAGWLALMSAVITTVVTVLKPQEKADQHHATGIGYQRLRLRLRQFIQFDCASGHGLDVLQRKLIGLTDEKLQLNAQAPSTPPFTYKAAKKAIDKGEAEYTERELTLIA